MAIAPGAAGHLLIGAHDGEVGLLAVERGERLVAVGVLLDLQAQRGVVGLQHARELGGEFCLDAGFASNRKGQRRGMAKPDARGPHGHRRQHQRRDDEQQDLLAIAERTEEAVARIAEADAGHLFRCIQKFCGLAALEKTSHRRPVVSRVACVPNASRRGTAPIWLISAAPCADQANDSAGQVDCNRSPPLSLPVNTLHASWKTAPAPVQIRRNSRPQGCPGRRNSCRSRCRWS